MAEHKEQDVKIQCSECGGGLRNHRIIKEHKELWDDEGAGMSGSMQFQICQCRGCDSFRFRKVLYCSEDFDPYTGEAIPSITVYPEFQQATRQIIEVVDLPIVVARIYRETVRAYNSGVHILAGGGLRAIVEGICKDQSVRGGSLQEKIDALQKQGLLTTAQADLLHEERYIGNSALHEIEPPGREDLEDGLSIIETLLSTIYVLPQKAKRLKAARDKKKAAKE
jgi:hypothetical protein